MPRPDARWLLLALLAGCSGGGGPDFTVHGTGVVVATEAPFARAPDLPARVESTLTVALAYWGGYWDDLAGVTVRLEEGRFVACGPTPSATGCFDGDIRVPTSDADFRYACVEQTSLVHEVGHAVIGDPGHLDPRWMDFAPVRDALAGRAAHGGAGATCELFVSVWRHPPSP